MNSVRLTAAQALVRFLGCQWSERDGIRRRAVPGHVRHLRTRQRLRPRARRWRRTRAARSTSTSRRTSRPWSTPRSDSRVPQPALDAGVHRVDRAGLDKPPDRSGDRHRQPRPCAAAGIRHVRKPPPGAGDAGARAPAARPISRSTTRSAPLSAFFDRITPAGAAADTRCPRRCESCSTPPRPAPSRSRCTRTCRPRPTTFPPRFFEPRTWHVTAGRLRPPSCGAAVEALRASERPLLIAGGGVHYSEALPELAELSERLGDPGCRDVGRARAHCPAARSRSAGIGRDRHARRQRACARSRPGHLRRHAPDRPHHRLQLPLPGPGRPLRRRQRRGRDAHKLGAAAAAGRRQARR